MQVLPKGPTIDQIMGFIQHSLILLRMEKDYAMVKLLVQCLKGLRQFSVFISTVVLLLRVTPFVGSAC